MKCKHCYSDAAERPAPDELSTSEAKKLLDTLADWGIQLLPVSIVSWLLGWRLSLAYAYSVLQISNPEVERFDLPLILFLGIVIYASLHPRPSRWQAVRLMFLGLVVAGVSAFITLLVYSLVLGMVTG